VAFDVDLFRDGSPFDHPAPGGGAPSIILSHGFTGTPAELRFLGERLRERGAGVHAPLLAGHGGGAAALSPTTWRDWAGTIEETAARVEGEGRGGPLFIGGLSLGALLAMRAYALRPGRFAGLVLMGLPLRLSLHNEAPIRLLGPLSRLRDIRVRKPAGPDILDREAGGRLPSGRAEVSMRAAASLVELCGLVRREVVPRVEGRPLLLHGARDRTAPVGNVGIFLREAVRARPQVRVFGNSAHLLPADREREAVAKEIFDFMQRGGPAHVETERKP